MSTKYNNEIAAALAEIANAVSNNVPNDSPLEEINQSINNLHHSIVYIGDMVADVTNAVQYLADTIKKN